MYHITTNQQRLAYVKVCVEVATFMKNPRYIKFELRNAIFVLVNMEVHWMLAKCSQCNILSW